MSFKKYNKRSSIIFAVSVLIAAVFSILAYLFEIVEITNRETGLILTVISLVVGIVFMMLSFIYYLYSKKKLSKYDNIKIIENSKLYETKKNYTFYKETKNNYYIKKNNLKVSIPKFFIEKVVVNTIYLYPSNNKVSDETFKFIRIKGDFALVESNVDSKKCIVSIKALDS